MVGAVTTVPATLQVFGPSRPEKDVHFLEKTNGLNCRKLLDPGWLDPDIFGTVAVRVACLAGLKSIYTVGQGVSSTRGPVKFNDIVDVIPFTRDWDKDPSEWIAVKTTNRHLWKTASPQDSRRKEFSS